MAEKIDFERFFEEEWRNRYMEKVPCEDIEDGCGDNEEGTLVDGFMFANRLLIWIHNYSEIAFFRQEEDRESYVPFELGEDIFKGASYELIPKLAESWMYPDDVVIFSEGKELFSGSANIGEVIDRVIKEQERLLSSKYNSQYGENPQPKGDGE